VWAASSTLERASRRCSGRRRSASRSDALRGRYTFLKPALTPPCPGFASAAKAPALVVDTRPSVRAVDRRAAAVIARRFHTSAATQEEFVAEHADRVVACCAAMARAPSTRIPATAG